MRNIRLKSEFDKAAGIYESIIAEFPEEAEGYWGLVLCNYGIEYVDDPATARKIPTCHRAAFESVANDENYQLALEYADVVSLAGHKDNLNTPLPIIAVPTTAGSAAEISKSFVLNSLSIFSHWFVI